MATEQRLIDAKELPLGKFVEPRTEWHQGWNDALDAAMLQATTVDAVSIEQFNELKAENDALKRLIKGEWVDCKLVQEAIGIDFSTGLKVFDFSRTAEWNPAPLNGQNITTKFRLKNAVEVVRCKDCACWKTAVVDKKGFLICLKTGMSIMANDYCSHGERST